MDAAVILPARGSGKPPSTQKMSYVLSGIAILICGGIGAAIAWMIVSSIGWERHHRRARRHGDRHGARDGALRPRRLSRQDARLSQIALSATASDCRESPRSWPNAAIADAIMAAQDGAHTIAPITGSRPDVRRRARLRCAGADQRPAPAPRAGCRSDARSASPTTRSGNATASISRCGRPSGRRRCISPSTERRRCRSRGSCSRASSPRSYSSSPPPLLQARIPWR